MRPITIVVPVYKTEKYIRECLESLLAQTYTELDIICVDDCSPDGSMDIVEEIGRRDSRVRFIKHDINQGLGPARNTGIAAAHGDLIGFVDSDDWIDPEMYQRLLELLDTHDADISQCSARRISKGRNIGSYPNSTGYRDKFLMHSMFGHGPCVVGAAWNKLYKTRLFHDHNITYPSILYEDVATTPRLLRMSSKVASTQESYLNYRFRDDSIVNSVDIETLIKRISGLLTASAILGDFFINMKDYSLEFIVNYRRFLIPQIERNIKIALRDGPDSDYFERCITEIETQIETKSRSLGFFLNDQQKLLKYFRNVSA